MIKWLFIILKLLSTKEHSLIVTKMAEEAQVERNQITMSKSEHGQEDSGEKNLCSL